MPHPDLVRVLQLAREGPREELPGILGGAVEIEAVIRLRLSEPATPAASCPRMLTVEEAVAIAGYSRRRLLARTEGMKFRCDLSRKARRFEETGFRRWLLEKH